MVAVSSSPPEAHDRIAGKLGLTFTLLSDPSGEAIEHWGLAHPGALPLSDTPVARPAIFIVDPQGIVRQRFLTENWRIRARPETLLDALRQLQGGGD